jgi:hypothetical protein
MTKSARIMCNSVDDPPRLTLSVQPVKHPDSLDLFVLTPFELNLDKNIPENEGKPWEYEIAVRNVSEEKFKIAMVSPPASEGIEVKMPRGHIKPGKEKKIKIKIDPSMGGELFNKSFTIEASDSLNTRYTLPIAKKTVWKPEVTSSH